MRRVTLRFDNGPTPGVTQGVLDVLQRAGIRGTFFVIGAKLDDPAAAAAMGAAHAAGHWIGNHTLTHSVAFGERPDAAYAMREIDETQRRIGALVHSDKLFRPYGRGGAVGPHLFSGAALAHLLDGRFCTVIWNSVPGDWKDPDGWVDRCVAEVGARDWAAVALHDVADACLGRLPELIDRLNRLGVEWRQDFPDSVVMTRGGALVSLSGSHVADCRQLGPAARRVAPRGATN